MSHETQIGTQTEAQTEAQALEQQIAVQRAQLAGTVDALSARLDVKSRAGAQVERTVDRMTTDSGKPRPEVWAGAGALSLAALALIWWRRQHR